MSRLITVSSTSSNYNQNEIRIAIQDANSSDKMYVEHFNGLQFENGVWVAN